MRRLTSLMVLALAAVGPAGAQEPVEQSLYAVQVQLLRQNALAWRSLDFEKSLATFRTLRDITTSRRDENKEMDLADIEFILRDLEKIQAFSPDQKEAAMELMREKVRASDSRSVGDHRAALKHDQRSLSLAKSLFGESSFFVIDGQICIARSLAIADDQESFASGTLIASEVLSTLKNLKMTNSYFYRDTLDILTKLYFRQDDYERATQVGQTTIELYKDQGAERTGGSAMLTGIVAEAFNRLGKHREALQYAAFGLNNDPPLDGVYDTACLRLLLEYARAKIALGVSENVGPAFEKLLSVSDEFAAAGSFPLDKRLEYREEYLAFLEKERNTERAEEVRKELDRLKLRAPLQKSRYSD